MRILNPQVEKDIAEGKPIRLNLGSGGPGGNGRYGVDCVALDGVDIIADLNEPLDLLPDDCADYVYSRHAVEHVANFMALIEEIWRITKPDGLIEIIAPHFSNPYGYSDPTHVRFFGLYTMAYFAEAINQPGTRKVPEYCSDARFYIESTTIEFDCLGFLDRLLIHVVPRLVNRSIRWQDFYERRLAQLYPAWQIRYLIRPDKKRGG
jgi:SAM-dependent methyltransferase